MSPTAILTAIALISDIVASTVIVGITAKDYADNAPTEKLRREAEEVALRANKYAQTIGNELETLKNQENITYSQLNDLTSRSINLTNSISKYSGAIQKVLHKDKLDLDNKIRSLEELRINIGGRINEIESKIAGYTPIDNNQSIGGKGNAN